MILPKPKLKCKKCSDTRWTYVVVDGEVVPRECSCLRHEIKMAYLGEIGLHKYVQSFLYMPNKDESGNVVYNEETGFIEGDYTVKNLYIRNRWPYACSHFHWALYAKKLYDPNFSFKVHSDEEILNVYLGKQSYQNRQKTEREDVEVFNSVRDLVIWPKLLILRLDVLGHANKAAANEIKEALMIRKTAGKPVWVVEGDRRFDTNAPSYSEALGLWLVENFEEIDLSRGTHTPVESGPVVVKISEESNGLVVDEDTYVSNYVAPASRSDDLLDDITPGKKKSFGGGYKKKRGNGPLG